MYMCVFVRSHSMSPKTLSLCVALLDDMNRKRKCIAIVTDTWEWLPPLEGMTLDFWLKKAVSVWLDTH